MPCGTHPTDGFKGRLKKRSRRLFHLPCDKRLPEKFLLLMFRAFFFRRPVTLESAATYSLPRGGRAGERAFPEWRQSFPNTLTAPIQALRLVALSLTLSHGREDGRLLGLKVLQGNRLCRLLFSFSDGLLNAQFIQQAVARMWGVCGTHAFPIFPVTPTHRVRALRHTSYRRVQRSSEKTLAAFVPSALR